MPAPKRNRNNKNNGDNDGSAGASRDHPGSSTGPSAETLKKETKKLEMRLREYEELIDKKNLDLDLKDKQLESMQQAMNEERERHGEEIKLANKERDMEKDDLAYVRSTLENRIARLECDLTAYNEMEEQNQMMSNKVIELMNQMDAQNSKNVEFTNRIKSESFNVRIMLEQKYRKELEEMDARYKEEAFQDINKESKRALIDNSRLEEELALQSVGITKLLKKYEHAEQVIKTLRMEKELLKQKVDLQIQSITKLKKNCRVAEARLESAKKENERLTRAATPSLPSQSGTSTSKHLPTGNYGLGDGGGPDQASQLRNALRDRARFKTLFEKAQNRSKTWKTRALQLSDRLIALQSSSSGPSIANTNASTSRANNASGSSVLGVSEGINCNTQSSQHVTSALLGRLSSQSSSSSSKDNITSMWSSRDDAKHMFGSVTSLDDLIHSSSSSRGMGKKSQRAVVMVNNPSLVSGDTEEDNPLSVTPTMNKSASVPIGVGAVPRKKSGAPVQMKSRRERMEKVGEVGGSERKQQSKKPRYLF